MSWTDRPGASERHDGARVAEFLIEGRIEWWAYPAGYKHRVSCPDLVQGPFPDRQLAKNALEVAIPFPLEPTA